MKRNCKNTIISFFILLSIIAKSHSQDILDLNNFTFNDSIIKELTIEKVTNMLGRPTATDNNQIAPAIYYHDKGLEFRFKSKSSDPQSRISILLVSVVKRWDVLNNEFYLPFAGTITPSINANMKSENLIALFEKYSIEQQSAEEIRKENKAFMKENKLYWTDNTLHDKIIVKMNNEAIVFRCEELTKYLDYFIIQ